MKTGVRDMEEADIEMVVDYFIDADEGSLLAMGADLNRLPSRKAWLTIMTDVLKLPDKEKDRYYQIWMLDDEPIGHSNINKIIYGDHAYMHLHMWQMTNRNTGLGYELLKLSIPNYFSRFELKKLVCEPYALNVAPNKTLKKLGFAFIKSYDTIPGNLAFHQSVIRYELTKENFK